MRSWLLVVFAITHLQVHADPVLAWNSLLLSINAIDHSLQNPDQEGPAKSSRAFAIVHVAIFDTVNSIVGGFTPYAVSGQAPGASVPAAVSAAAYTTLSDLYPQHRNEIVRFFQAYMATIPEGPSKAAGLALGTSVGQAILSLRRGDGSEIKADYRPVPLPGVHLVDPTNPDQGYGDPNWGQVRPFTIPSAVMFRSPPPERRESPRFHRTYHELMSLGGDGTSTPTQRSPEHTLIGLYWAYDGTPGIGAPSRMFNQIAHVIAQKMKNDFVANARLFALINVAMADVTIQTWESKYFYAYWRPIVAIRALADPNWTPLGAPLSNRVGPNFTPNFPSYPSGHASFAGAFFHMMELFYGTDKIPFTFVSDELNGRTRDSMGRVRPLAPRHFKSFRAAAEEAGQSRIYLGIHWEFDKTEGLRAGARIARYVYDHAFRPLASARLRPPRTRTAARHRGR